MRWCTLRGYVSTWTSPSRDGPFGAVVKGDFAFYIHSHEWVKHRAYPMRDEFSKYYSDFLTSAYDSVDRIVLNGYFIQGCIPGGFRNMWRDLHGSDKDLDNTHLMRFAQRTGRRRRAYAKAHRIPVIDCRKDDRKHEMAAEYIPEDTDCTGVFAIFVGRAPASVWDIQHTKDGRITNIAKKKTLSFVNHYSFHIMDAEWGHVTIKLCGHLPFTTQIILNGHEYIACQARKLGIDFIKEDNCFTEIADAPRLWKVADTLSQPEAIGHLKQVCERWIYSSCLCFALSSDEQQRCGFQYQYSVYQTEYSRNLLFERGRDLDQVFHGIVDRTRSKLNVKILKTIFGAQKRPTWRKGKKAPRLQVVVETPKYDMTVFKIHFGKLTAKLYTKGERVLRIEIIIHNARVLRCGRSLPKFTEIIDRLHQILERFLENLHCVDVAQIADATFDELPMPSEFGTSRIAGIDLNQKRTRVVMDAILELSIQPGGFTSSELAQKVEQRSLELPGGYTTRKAAYDLRKFRAKNLVCKEQRARKYNPVPDGLKTMTALSTLREKVLKPVLASAVQPTRGRRPGIQSPIDAIYRNIQKEFKALFHEVGIVTC